MQRQREGNALRVDLLRRSLTIGAVGGIVVAAVSVGCLVVLGTVVREGLGLTALRDTAAALLIYPPLAAVLGGLVGMAAGAIGGIGLAMLASRTRAPLDAGPLA